jgi:transposase
MFAPSADERVKMLLFGGFTPPAARQTTVVFFMETKKVGTIIFGCYICKGNNNKTVPTMQRKEISFKGQKIYIGIDVHKTTWVISVLTDSGYSTQHSQKASAKMLFEYLKNNFPDGDYYAVYESGFTGFSTFYALEEFGIKCTVAHACDIPTTQYETVMKTDKVDAAKLARSLKNESIRPIYIRPKENLDDLAAIRVRKAIMKDLAAFKTRVKHLLHFNGVEIPVQFSLQSRYWTKAFIDWLKNDVKFLSETRASLDLLIAHVESDRSQLLIATRKLRALGQSEKYHTNFELLMSIPGIGATTAMCILTEICEVSRFKNERQFASYLGLVPTCHNSGAKVSTGEMTFRGNKEIQTMLIEASWVAQRKDPGLSAAYLNFIHRGMNCQMAIIRIARKLSNIIFAVLKTQKRYEPYKEA